MGKAHLATSIGIATANKRPITYFIKCHNLILNIKKAKLEIRLKRDAKYKLLIIHEIGYLPIDSDDANFFQLIDLNYENKSTIFTTNSNFKEWAKTLQNPKLANAILNRVLYHATVVNIVGNSYRLKDPIKNEK